MGLRLCVLASSSSGNCTYVASRTTAILIDAGLSPRAIAQGLSRLGASLGGIAAVCVTHEHGDHVAGLGVLQSQWGTPVYANHGTQGGLRRATGVDAAPCRSFRTGEAFAIGDLVVTPFAVRHDAEEPVGFAVAGPLDAVGVTTDLGEATDEVRRHLRGCSAVVLESNHDEGMLMASRRPGWLKERIRGPEGHLSNNAAAELLTDIAAPVLQQVFLAHLSTECNTPARARRSAAEALRACGYGHVSLELAHPDRMSQVREAG